MRNPTYVELEVAPSDIPSAITTTVPAVGRALISALFVLSGLSKLAAPAMTIEYIEAAGLPLPSMAFGLAAFVEIIGGITLLLGYRTRIVASVLFLFVVATAVFFHRNLGDPDQLTHFLKNMAIAGGLMHVVASPARSTSPPGAGRERGYSNLSYFHEGDKGGHFAAWEQPLLFASEMRAAFKSLR